MSEQLEVSAMPVGEVRIAARLKPEEVKHSEYVRGLSTEEARALAAELLRAADEADADPSTALLRPGEETTP